MNLTLDDLNLTEKCDQGFEFEYIDDAGKGTGFFITVLGSESNKVQEWIRRQLNQRRFAESQASKRGKELERSVEDDIDFGNQSAAIRIVSWRGLKASPAEDAPEVKYSADLALQIVTMNSRIREAVLKESSELANFSKRS